MGNNSSAFLFSPNFDRYIDYTRTKNMFIIRNINYENNKKESKSSDDDSSTIEISTDIVSTKDFPNLPVKTCIQFLASRMMFVCDRIVRIVNEEGIDFLLEIEGKELNLLSYTKVDNFNPSPDELPIHTFREKTPIPLKEVFFRIIRKN